MTKLFLISTLNTSISGMTIDALRQEFFKIQNAATNAKNDTDEYSKAIIRLVELTKTLDRFEREIKKIENIPSYVSEAIETGACQVQAPYIPTAQLPKHNAAYTQTKKLCDNIKGNKHEQPLKAYVQETKISEAQKRIKGIEERAEF